jgi:hypothetical protein
MDPFIIKQVSFPNLFSSKIKLSLISKEVINYSMNINKINLKPLIYFFIVFNNLYKLHFFIQGSFLTYKLIMV